MAKTLCVIGLGNPGTKYLHTWHNLGFLAVDYLAQKYAVKFVTKSKLRSEIAEVFLDGSKLVLVKPQTFMNLSGEACALLAKFYSLDLNDILVVFDDFDLPQGTNRLRDSGSAGTHNGMRSIIACMNSNEIPRYKIGFKPEHPVSDLSSFVLSSVPKPVQPLIAEAFAELDQILQERLK